MGTVTISPALPSRCIQPGVISEFLPCRHDGQGFVIVLDPLSLQQFNQQSPRRKTADMG